MIVSFENKEIRQLCENEVSSKRQLGEEFASILQARLSDLEAAVNIYDLIVGNPQEVFYNDERCYTISVSENLKILLSNNDLRNKVDFDWKDIKRVKILKLYNHEFSS